MNANSSNRCYSSVPPPRPNGVEAVNMSRNFGIPFIALAAALIVNTSAATAQSQYRGNSGGGRNYNNSGQQVNPTNPSNSYQQPSYQQPSYQQPQGNSNGYQGQVQQGQRGFGGNRGNSYATPGYGGQQYRSGGG